MKKKHTHTLTERMVDLPEGALKIKAITINCESNLHSFPANVHEKSVLIEKFACFLQLILISADISF